MWDDDREKRALARFVSSSVRQLARPGGTSHRTAPGRPRNMQALKRIATARVPCLSVPTRRVHL